MISSHTEREIASCKTATHIPATIIQMEGNDIQTWVSKDSINKLDFEKEKKEKKKDFEKKIVNILRYYILYNLFTNNEDFFVKQ